MHLFIEVILSNLQCINIYLNFIFFLFSSISSILFFSVDTTSAFSSLFLFRAFPSIKYCIWFVQDNSDPVLKWYNWRMCDRHFTKMQNWEWWIWYYFPDFSRQLLKILTFPDFSWLFQKFPKKAYFSWLFRFLSALCMYIVSAFP